MGDKWKLFLKLDIQVFILCSSSLLAQNVGSFFHRTTTCDIRKLSSFKNVMGLLTLLHIGTIHPLFWDPPSYRLILVASNLLINEYSPSPERLKWWCRDAHHLHLAPRLRCVYLHSVDRNNFFQTFTAFHCWRWRTNEIISITWGKNVPVAIHNFCHIGIIVPNWTVDY